MILIDEKTTLANLQHLIVGRNFNPSNIGRYAVIRSPDNCLFLCKIWKRSSLNYNYCILNKSVEIFPSSKYIIESELNSFGSNSKSNLCNIVNCECIEIIPKINNIKSLTVSIIFKDPWKRLKWNNKEVAFMETLKDLLKLFVITENSAVHLYNFKEFDLLGIHIIKILSLGSIAYGRVVRTTKLKIESKISISTYEQLILSKPDNLLIHHDSLQDLTMILNYRQRLIRDKVKCNTAPLSFIQQVLLIGPRGCGKNTLLKKACFDNCVVSIDLDLSDVLSLKYEERKLYYSNKLKFAQALSSEVDSELCMIIVKQIESITSKSGKSLSLLNSFLKQAIDVPNVILVATSDAPQSLDLSLRSSSKFGIEIYLNIPNERTRCSIVSHLFSKFKLSSDSYLNIARNTPGFVLSDLVMLMKRSIKLISTLKNPTESDLVNVIKSFIKTVQPLSVRGAIGIVPCLDAYSIDKIGGLDGIKKKLTHIVIWPILFSASFKRMNVTPPSGVLLYGPPGCAKTSLVRAISNSCKTTFLSVSAADLYSPFVGDAEKTVSLLFQRARASAPTVLFIDEIDALVGSRSFHEKGAQERVLSTFLIELDGVGFKKGVDHSVNEKYHPVITVIAATNRPQAVDSALIRPGRLDTLVYVPPPDMNQRKEILAKITADIKVDDNLPLMSIAMETEYYSGADLVNLCREAGLQAIDAEGSEVSSINKSHFDHALKNMKPSLSPEQIAWYEEFTFG